MVRPTAAELDVARALIARAKAADPSIKKADELLVCAAVAYRAGEFNKVPTACARAMGKEISRPSQVTNWVARLEKLEQTSTAASVSGLQVQPAWIEEHAPGISNLSVAPMAVSPGGRHGKRAISTVSTTPLGRGRAAGSSAGLCRRRSRRSLARTTSRCQLPQRLLAHHCPLSGSMSMSMSSRLSMSMSSRLSMSMSMSTSIIHRTARFPCATTRLTLTRIMILRGTRIDSVVHSFGDLAIIVVR